MNTFSYARLSPFKFLDFLGLSAADVSNVVDHVNENFPEIRTQGGWEFGNPGAGNSAFTDNWSGKITLHEMFKKECLTEDEFFKLYFSYLHEAMHSTDSAATRMWDGAFGSTRNHRRIRNRESYEQYGVEGKGTEEDGMWGYERGEPPRPDVSDKVQELYEITRPCACEK